MPRANTKVFPTAPQKWQKYVFAYTWKYVFLLYHHIPLVVLFSFFFQLCGSNFAWSWPRDGSFWKVSG